MLKKIFLFLLLLSISVHANYPGKKSKWHGFDLYEDGGNKIVVPDKIADGRPWVWRARFFGHEPQFDIAMLKKGYHIVYCDVSELYGNQEAVEKWNSYYNFLRLNLLLADRGVLEAFSRGGLIAYNWAAQNPEKVAAIYADAPVMDFKSWPKINPKILKLYGFKYEAEAKAWKKNPVDNLIPLARVKVPIIHVVGEADKVVPVAENTNIAEERYRKLGGIIKVIRKKGVGHHPHSLKDPSPMVDFILRFNTGKKTLRAEEIVSDKNFILRGNFNNSRIQFEQKKEGHVAFIGGSITEMHGYRPRVCNMLRKRFPSTKFNFTAAGISSTCSTTGAFRLDRDVLSKGPVDMLFIDFTVNDDQDAGHSRENCIRGMEGMIAQARAHNPHVDIIITHFVNRPMLKLLRNGEQPVAIKAHNDLAEYHNISVTSLAQELADLINAGKMEWKNYGGVHPNTFGSTICSSMMENALLKGWLKPLPENSKKVPYKMKPLMDPKSYAKGRFLPLTDVKINDDWQLSIPKWKEKKLGGSIRSRFLEIPFIHGDKVGAKLSVKFTGTAIGAYMLSGIDTAVISCKVDGGKSKIIDTIHHFSDFNYPHTVILFNELEDGEHVLELEILENREGRIRKGGTAFRVMHFTAN